MARYEFIADFLRRKVNDKPEVGIICGSGLNGLSTQLKDATTIEYESIPGFPRTSVLGHCGQLVFGDLNGIKCVCMRGRFHSYEGFDMATVTLPVRVMRLLGVKLLLVTNAAGGLNRDFNVGDIMVITDHFGLPALAGKHPLVGPNEKIFGTRFPAMSDAYDPQLRELVIQTAEEQGCSDKIRQGVYCFVSGPTYETPAECKFLATMGDAVGMSTVPEIIVAKHCGMAILGLSLITNKVVLPGDAGSGHASHEEVLEATSKSTQYMEGLVRGLICWEKIGLMLAHLPDVQYQESEEYRRIKRQSGLLKMIGLIITIGAVAVSTVLLFKRP